MHPAEWLPLSNMKLLALVAAVLCLLLAAAVAYAGREKTATGTVGKVFNGKSFVLKDRQVVRLAGLQAPNPGDGPKRAIKRPAEPLAEESMLTLMRLVLNQKVKLVSPKQPFDRKGRRVAQAYLEDGTWVQGEMLRSGMAMVYGFPDQRANLPEMLKLEAEAREKKRGIWANPYYRVLQAEEAGESLDRFRLVEGRVLKVGEAQGRVFLNFGKEYQKDFTVSIAKADRKRFGEFDFAGLEGQKIRVRGWIYPRGGPMIEVTHPEQIERIR